MVEMFERDPVRNQIRCQNITQQKIPGPHRELYKFTVTFSSNLVRTGEWSGITKEC